MHKTLRQLPSLDFLRGFEAAGRRLSFTLAARGALPHAVGAVAAGEGARGRARRAAVRAPAPRARADAGRRRVPSRRRRRAAARSRGRRRRARRRAPGLTRVDHVSFASLWVIPRLPAFRAAHPDVEVYVVGGRPPGRSRARRRRRRRPLPGRRRRRAMRVRLFGERMLPVVSPALVRSGAAARTPADLAQHVLLHLDDPEGRMPWLNWPAWLAANGAARTASPRARCASRSTTR